MSRDFYTELGVDRSATEDEIRRAYRKLAHKYHPDKTGGDKVAEDKLKVINEAYDVLKNKVKRAKYDQFGEQGAQFGAGGGGFQSGSPFDDIFDAFFGGSGAGRQGARATVGHDLEYRVQIDLRAAAFGIKKELRFQRLEACSECSGTGAAKGSAPESCSQCAGVGQVRMAQGFFSITRTCPRCGGSGKTITHPCRRCRGQAYVKTDRELSVDIPAGVDTGSRLRVPGEGEPGRGGGPRGDLYVHIEVLRDDFFVREGNDITCDVPIQFTQAILGSTVRVPSLNGETDLKIPAGTQSGTVFRLRGLGFPDIRGYKQGDQLVKLQVETPTKLSKEQKELIRHFEDLSDVKTYPLHKRFLDKLKSSFSK